MSIQYTVFVDASAWIALTDTTDSLHSSARQTYRQLLKQRKTLITTNLILAEVYVLLYRRAGHRVAIRFLETIGRGGSVRIVYPESDIHEQAIRILRQYPDQDFSLADAVSFAVMQQSGIQQAFSLDHHFLVSGFELLPY